MNNINFIKPVPPLKEREVRLWSWFTIIGSSSALVIIAIYTGMQWSLYRSLFQEKMLIQQKLGSFDTVLKQQRTQTEEQEQLQKKNDLLTKYKTSPKNPAATLNALHAITGNGLQSVTISKNRFELHVACRNAHHATICLQKLRHDTNIRTVKLTSLQSNQKQVIAIFKGETP